MRFRDSKVVSMQDYPSERRGRRAREQLSPALLAERQASVADCRSSASRRCALGAGRPTEPAKPALLIPSQRGCERRAVLERRGRKNGTELEDIPAMQGVEAGGPTIEGLPGGSLPRKVGRECSI